MSIPTVFTNANCLPPIPGSLDGGTMLKFCNTFKPGMPGLDVCSINTQEDYNEYQMGCINGVHSKFVDNNNNTVWLEIKPGYLGVLDKPVEFPVGSHDNIHYVPAPHYLPPYPVFVGQENCIGSRITYSMCCVARPTWSFIETPNPEGKCVLIDKAAHQSFAHCCVNSLHGTYVDPINGTTISPTGDDPVTQLPTGGWTDPSSTLSEKENYTNTGSESDKITAKPTHTVTITKCLV